MSKLTDELYERLRITNPYDFARRAGVPGYIQYKSAHAHAFGYTDRRGEVVEFVGSRHRATPFRERGGNHVEERSKCIAAAQAEGSKRWGVTEWKLMPWRNAWISVEGYAKVMDELKAHRTAHPALPAEES